MYKLSKKDCNNLQNYFRNYVINIALLSYFLLVIVTMFVCFLIFYYMTKDPNYKFKNGVAVFIIIFFASLVIPIIILEIYCLCKGIEMFKLLGGDYNKFSQTNLIQSVEIKNDDYELAKKRRENGNNINYNLENEFTNSNIKTNNKFIDMKENNILKGKIKKINDLIYDEKPKTIVNDKELNEKY
jgi:hypothetical protein